MWQPIAHTCELTRPGDFVMLPWINDGEVAVTNIDGQLVAFDNICPHRGSRIFKEMRGNRPPVCGYHGRCAKVGQLRLYAGVGYGGFLFVSRNQVGGADLGDVIENFFEAAGADLRLHSTLSFTMDCDWRVAIDNTLDAEHVDHVHGDSLAKLKLERADLVGFADGSSIETFKSADNRLALLARVLQKPAEFDYVHAHTFPRACLSSTGGWTYSLQNYFPRADGRTQFVHRLYVKPGIPDWFSNSVAKLNEQIFREDAAICAGIRADFKANYGPRDDRIRHFRSRCQ